MSSLSPDVVQMTTVCDINVFNEAEDFLLLHKSLPVEQKALFWVKKQKYIQALGNSQNVS